MKKIFYLIGALSISMAVFTSCLESDGNSAEATIEFGSRMDSITFSDPADTVFTSAIDTALQEMGVLSTFNSAGIPSVLFKEHASVDVSSIPYAVMKAVEQANTTYKKKLDGATRDQLIRYIQVAKTPAPLPVDSLGAFKVNLGLIYTYGSTGLSVAGNYDKQF